MESQESQFRKTNELKEAEEKTKRILETIAESYVEYDNEWRYVNVNSKYEETFGQKRDEIIGKVVWELLPQTVGSLQYKELHRAKKENITVRFEAKSLVTGDWFEVNAFPHPDGLTVYLHNITDRKKAEEKLKESEEKFSKVFHANPGAIAILKPEGPILEVNDEFINLTGYNRDEIIGRSSVDLNFVRAEFREKVYKKMQEKGPCHNLELEIQTKSGEKRAVLNTIENVEIKGQKRIISIFYDITERKKSEDALKRVKRDIEGLCKIPLRSSLRINPQGIIQFANERALEFFGYSADELIGKHAVGTIVPEHDTAGRDLAAMVDEITKNPDGFHSNENENIRKNGERVWMEWTNSGIYDKYGHLKEFLSVGIDATERKKAEETLKESEKRYKQFFDNPLNGFALCEIITDKKGEPIDFVYLEVNKAFENFTGLKKEEVLNKKVTDIFPFEEVAEAIKIYGSVALTGESKHFTIPSTFIR